VGILVASWIGLSMAETYDVRSRQDLLEEIAELKEIIEKQDLLKPVAASNLSTTTNEAILDNKLTPFIQLFLLSRKTDKIKLVIRDGFIVSYSDANTKTV